MRLLMLAFMASIWAAVGGLASGCAGTETGNGQRPRDPVTRVEMKLTDQDGESPHAAIATTDADGATLTLDGAWVHVDRLDFRFADGVACSEVFDPTGFVVPAVPGVARPAATCGDDDDSLRLDGPFFVDLLTGDADPALDEVTLPAGSYRSAAAKLSKREPGSPGEDLLGDATLAATGTLGEGADAQPFALSLTFTDFAAFEGPLAADANTPRVLLLFDVRGWFSALPIAACAAAGEFEVAPDGALLLRDGPGGCKELEAALKDAIKASGRIAADDGE